jgi:hypothetical protein
MRKDSKKERQQEEGLVIGVDLGGRIEERAFAL